MQRLNLRYLPVTRAMQLKSPFARFHFAPAEMHGGGLRDISLPLPLVGDPDRCEVWELDGESHAQVKDGITCIDCADYRLLIASNESNDDIESASTSIYARLLPVLEEYRQVIKIWNYLPGINIGSGDDERYKRFCSGRARAFIDAGLDLQAPPAGTAVGCDPDTPLMIVLLATQHSIETVENPRQISAFRYPRQYGPRSPSFSRAAQLAGATSKQLFLSGTAAIVGHESRHAEDLKGQAAETLRNLESLIGTANGESPCAGSGLYRLYLRQPDQLDDALDALAPLAVDQDQLVVLKADICRTELLLEVDGLIGAEEV